jgi:hypothetical protein
VVAIAFRKFRPLGIRSEHSFRGHVPTAHTLAYLRFVDLVAETAARLATGSGGLTPRRAGFAPAGRQIEFHGVIASPPIPIDQQSLVALFCLSSEYTSVLGFNDTPSATIVLTKAHNWIRRKLSDLEDLEGQEPGVTGTGG